MRFKVDENLPAEVAAALRDAGHDAPTVLDQEAGGMPDTSLATLVKQEARALLTLSSSQERDRPPFFECRGHLRREMRDLVESPTAT